MPAAQLLGLFGVLVGVVSGAKPPVPADGSRLLILGQDEQSISDYMGDSSLPRPSGFTVYITLSRGQASYDGSYCFKGLDGLKDTDAYRSNNAEGCGDNGRRQNHWGSGEQNVQRVIETYKPQVVSIGLWCPSNDRMPSLYQDGAYDDLLDEFAEFLKSHQGTSFFLRTCYEFNGDAGGWAFENFRETFKYVRTFLEGKGVGNVAYVWQSDSYHGTGRGTSAIGDQEEGYWPGKRYVDWVGSSQFNSDVGEEAAIAEAEGLPHFIAEATPHGELFHQYDFGMPYGTTGKSPDGSVTLHHDVDWFDQKQGEIERTSTKAWAYINADWTAQPQWANAADQAGQNFFKYTDSRVQISERVKSRFIDLVASAGFVEPTDGGSPPSLPRTPKPPSPRTTPKPPSPRATPEPPSPRTTPEPPSPSGNCNSASYPHSACGRCWTDAAQAASGGCTSGGSPPSPPTPSPPTPPRGNCPASHPHNACGLCWTDAAQAAASGCSE